MMGTVLKIAFLFTLVLIASQTAYSIPFIVLHGFADECKSDGVSNLTKVLIDYSEVDGYCLEIGNGYKDSVFMPLQKQYRIACEKAKEMKELAEGYNIVGISQGNLIARGLIQFCDGGPPIKNYISIGGPHAGVVSDPLCFSKNGTLCNIVNAIIKRGVYTDYVQDKLAPSNYIKIPTDIDTYLNKSKYLPQLNNERPNERNITYKQRFSSLQNLILIMSTEDEVIVPRESSLFGYYPDGSLETLLPAQETLLYKEDWIGLKILEDAGRVEYVSVKGRHCVVPDEDIKKYIVPYLANEKKTSTLDEEVNMSSFSGRFASASDIGGNETDENLTFSI